MRFLQTLLVIVLVIAGCRNDGNYREDDLFIDYQVTGEEGADQVSVLVQFRERNSYGPTVELRPGSAISLDGKALELNKGTRNGPIYVASRPLNEFKGTHQLIFVDSKGKELKQDFTFSVFTLEAEGILSRPIDSAGFVLKIKGMPAIRTIRILMTDTSYAGKEVDKTIAVNNDLVQIRKKDLAGLRPGPVQLELMAEQHSILKRKGQTCGALNVSYTLRREFQWKAPADSSLKP